MNIFRALLATTALLTTFSGCAESDDAGTTTQRRQALTSFVIEEWTQTVFAGHRTLDGRTARFRAEMESENAFRVSVDVAGTMVTITGDRSAGVGGVIAYEVENGQWSSEADVRLLSALTHDLGDALPWPETVGGEDPARVHEGMLRDAVSFFATARHGFVNEGRFRIDLAELPGWPEALTDEERPPAEPFLDVPALSTDTSLEPSATSASACNAVPDDDLCTHQYYHPLYCRTPGVQILAGCCGATTAPGKSRAFFHDATSTARQPGFCNGGTSLRFCGKAAQSSDCASACCPGRCGLACKALPFYAQDCFDHDECVATQSGSSFTNNKDCGDEFNEASSDFAFIHSHHYSLWWSKPGVPSALWGCK